MAAKFESLRTVLSSHRAITRVSLAALSFTFLIAFSHQEITQAGPEQAPLIPESLLPQSVGIAVATTDAITIPFQESMDPASVESAIQVLPQQRVDLSWNADYTAVSISPERLWRADERYLVVVGQASRARDARGADPLEEPRARHGAAVPLHPDRREDRADRPDRELGARGGAPQPAALARRGARRPDKDRTCHGAS